MGFGKDLRASAASNRRCTWLLLAIACGLLALAPAAQASFHRMKIREIYTGGASGGSYIELQMVEGGQSQVAGHPVVVYNPDGTAKHTFSIPSNVTKGENQRTVLIAGQGHSGPTADATDSGLDLSAAGGAVCFTQGTPIDCVAWGNFTGNVSSLPSPGAGTPASPGGVTAGKALHRSILATPCETLLEESDDTNNSAADFSEQAPNPRNNAGTILEKACPAPTATIDSGPASPTKETSASFTYHSESLGAEFECKLDAGAFLPCEAIGITYAAPPLTSGNHIFRVRAKDAHGTGAADTHEWTVDTVAPTVVLDSQPKALTPTVAPPQTTITAKPGAVTKDRTPTFRFKSSLADSPFECKVDRGAFSSCRSPFTTKTLSFGSHTVQVRASAAGLADPTPAKSSFKVTKPKRKRLR